MSPVSKAIESVVGVLRHKQSNQHYKLNRQVPNPKFDDFIEQYWMVEWDLVGKPAHIQQNIPAPCVNITFDDRTCQVFGPVTRKFSYSLEGKGKIIGIKFRPAGFSPLLVAPLNSMTDKTFGLDQITSQPAEVTQNQLMSSNNIAQVSSILDQFLDSSSLTFCNQKTLRNIHKVNFIVGEIVKDSGLTRVEQLSEIFAIPPRTLQRLFNEYVGLSPKWVLRKYRMHDVLELLESNKPDFQQIIADLGYYDQAHFINDFKSMTGQTPTNYLQQMSTGPSKS